MASIKAFFMGVGADTLVTTRQLIKFGLRATVDTCTFKLVQDGAIVRVARGVFHLTGRESPPSIEEVAQIKAKSFGRNIMTDALRVAEDLELRTRDQSENCQHCFQIDGRSSSFKYGDITIKFKGTSKKNFALGDTPHGRVLRALQSLGKAFITEDLCERALRTVSAQQYYSVMESCSFVSAWLSDMIIHWLFSSAIQPNGSAIDSVLVIEGAPTNYRGTNVVSEPKPTHQEYYPFKRSEHRSHKSAEVTYFPSTFRSRAKNE